jgi:nucleotide-binding universal stress UspA family protein
MNIQRILLATDFSSPAGRAEDYAASFAAKWHAQLTVMTVLEFLPGLDPEYPVNQHYLTQRMSEATDQLAEVKQRWSRRGIVPTTRIATGIPSEEIHKAALAEDSDLLVVGTSGKTGLAHVLLGSTAERLIRTAPCPVLAVRLRQSSEHRDVVLKRLLVPIDGSDCSLDALEYAAAVATLADASIDVLHVLEPVSYGLDFTFDSGQQRAQTRERLTKKVDELCTALSASGLTVKGHVVGGLPGDSILSQAETLSSDVIVMGTHGRRGLSHALAGSVTEAVLRRAQCPILTVRSPKFRHGHRLAPAKSPL